MLPYLLPNVHTMNAPIAAPLLYPVVSEAAMKSQYIGTNILSLPTPAAIIDRAVARRNCDDMLDAARSLGLEFRPHVKTHKVGKVLSLLIFCHMLCNVRVWYMATSVFRISRMALAPTHGTR